MNEILRLVFFVLIVRPVVFVLLGLNIRRRSILPSTGPAILVANHNSHLDTMVLISLLPLRQLTNIRPVGSASHFLSTPLLAWFAKRILRIIAVQPGTGRPRHEVLAEALDALDEGNIIIIFPEGMRGEPERLGLFRSGIATLARLRPEVSVYPVYLHGLGKALPKGDSLLVPFVCDALVGQPMRGLRDEAQFMLRLLHKMENLALEGDFAEYR